MTIKSVEDLKDVLRSCVGGETLHLGSGDYGALHIAARDKIPAFDPPVRIISDEPLDRATFDRLDLRDVTGLIFDNVLFNYTFQQGDPRHIRPFQVGYGSSNVAIRNCLIAGDVAHGIDEISDGYAWASGFAFRDCTDVAFENNTLHTFFNGLIVSGCEGVTVRGNDIHSMRMDGTNFAAVKNVLIEGNRIHDFRGSPNSKDHCDMIQFWTNGTETPSENITIRGNRLDIGAGYPTQSIFMRNDQVDRGMAGHEMFYRNIVIEDNAIINGHLHGITVGETDGLVIRNNHVLHSNGQYADERDSRPLYVPTIRVGEASRNVEVSGNITGVGHTGLISGYIGQPGWLAWDNSFVQDRDPGAPGYYSDPYALLPGEPEPVAPDGVQIGTVWMRGGEMILRLDAAP